MKKDQFTEVSSEKKGIWGFIESSLRRTRNLTFMLFYLVVVGICLLCIGSALGMGIGSYSALVKWLNFLPLWWTKGLSLAISFFVYGISLLIIVPLVNSILFLPKLVKPFRGNAYSLEAMPWFLHNALLYIVRYSFLEYVTPSPLNIFFYRAMGMKIGKGCFINTTNISDACCISLGDYVTIGGSAYLIAHYSTEGFLILSKVEIGSKTTIGLKATVFGNVKIGDYCVVKPHGVVLPKSVLENNSRV